MTPAADTAFAAFAAPWRAAFPALALAEVFASTDEQPRLLARSLWVMEAADAIWKVSDAGIGSAKLGWWHQEWQRAAQGIGAHPLSGPLAIVGSVSPLAVLLQEQEAAPPADGEARWQRYRQLAESLTQAFSADHAGAGSAPDPAERLLWMTLLGSRHLAALWQGAALAVAALPLDLRAGLQLATNAGAGDAVRRAAQGHAVGLVRQLRSEWQRLPATAWRGQRGARVLTDLALREMLHLGAPITRWSRPLLAMAAWRVARGVDQATPRTDDDAGVTS